MQIRLMEGLFEPQLFELELQEDKLVLRGDRGQERIILLSQLRHFNLEGSGKKLNQFFLETGDRTYEGRFLNPGDGECFLALLREKCGCYLDIRMDIE